MAIGSALNSKKHGDVPEEVAAPAAAAEADTAALPEIPERPAYQPSALPAAVPDDAWTRAWAAAPVAPAAAPPLLPAPGAVVAVMPLSARAPRGAARAAQNRSAGAAPVPPATAPDRDDGLDQDGERDQDDGLDRDGGSAQADGPLGPQQDAPAAPETPARPLRRSAAAARAASTGHKKQRARTPKGSGGRGNSGSGSGRSGTSAGKRTDSSRRGGATEVPPLTMAVPQVSPAELPATFSAPVRTLPGNAAHTAAGVAASRGAVTALAQPVPSAETEPGTASAAPTAAVGAPPAQPAPTADAAPEPDSARPAKAEADAKAEAHAKAEAEAHAKAEAEAHAKAGAGLGSPVSVGAGTAMPPGREKRRRRPLGVLPGPEIAPEASGTAAPGTRPDDDGIAQLGLTPVAFTGVPTPDAVLPGGTAATADPQAGVTLSARLLAAATAPPLPEQPPLPGPPPTDTGLPSPEEITLLRRSLMVVEPVADRATAHFYAVLFLARPELRALFPAAMDVQRDRLFRALLAAARTADDVPALSSYLSRLAVVHRKFGVRDEHYGPVGAALLAALERYCGSRWDGPTRQAWVRLFGLISRVMIAAAAEDARHSPAWWQGEVVSVDRRTSDVAVVTVRTDQPYPFRAGQHTQLEVPWWPRVWRHYSIANAPNRAGLLSFHVKAVPAGWVSNALVLHAQPGVRLRLGPPQGGMTLDQDSADPLLLVGGGTGIAPLLALVEELAAQGGTRKVELFYGARRPRDLYAAPYLVELTRRHSWLSVRTCVSEAGGDGGPHVDAVGRLPEVVAGYGPWDGYRACVSGPPAMVRRTVTALGHAGVPAELVRHDLADLPEESTALRGRGRR